MFINIAHHIQINLIIIKLSWLHHQANGADEDGTTFPGLGKIDYVLTEASVKISSLYPQEKGHASKFPYGLLLGREQTLKT